VSLVEPGSSLALGGAVHANRPAAFVRELVRRGTGQLVLHASPGAGWDVDLLIACGLVRKTVVPMVTLGELGLAPSFRLAVETGEIEAAYTDAMSRTAAYLAAAYGHPFHLIGSLEGTNLVDDPELFDVLTDSDGNAHRAARAVSPDLCVLHVEEADEYGNVRHARGRVMDVLAARASRRTVVVADRLVSNRTVRAEPHRTTIPSQYVQVVVECPFGAHPTATGEYQADIEHLRLYAHAAEQRRRGDAAAFGTYLDRYVTGPSDELDYREAIGGEAVEQRLREELRASHD